MEIYAVYREAAQPHEQPLFITVSYEVARRKAKTYPGKTRIVSRTLHMGYGVQLVQISGQLKCITYNGQNAWLPDKVFIVEEQREGGQ